ncbi:hypothetical protein INT45_002684 [Circinella minor]|uniref:Uncharacterized protein n=1 Tax=Circinella minor TaxID=1195481 RepID=A0A8H7S6U3_9FUNG|nr:hypothetical protein INT45_002684 [Circinella minor]
MTTEDQQEGNGKHHEQPTERTGLLGNGNGNSTTGNYSSSASPPLVAVVDIPASSSEGAPVVPSYLLTTTVRKVVKQHRKAELIIKVQEQQIRYAQRYPAPPTGNNKKITRPRRDSNTSSSSSSSSSSDDDDTGKSTMSLRKRDIIKNALKSAKEQWKDEHGWSSSTSLLQQHPHLLHGHHHGGSSSSLSQKKKTEQQQHIQKNEEEEEEEGQVPTTTTDTLPAGPLPINPAQRLTLPPLEQDIWKVAKHASVCTLIAMSKKDETEKLALTTLEYGMKASSGTSLVLRELLLRPWLDNQSALEWAITNDCQIFLSDARVQSVVDDAWKFYGPTDWQEVPDHPFSVWKKPNNNNVVSSSNFLVDYLARWAAPRYQAYVGLVCGLIYLGLHLATVSNKDYFNTHPYDFEYAYYAFVCSDLVLELYKILLQPVQAVKRPSTYLSLVTAAFLFTSLTLRLVALYNTNDSLEHQQILLTFSYDFLVWATPLMIFRIALWTDNLCWQVAKARHLVSQCIVDALWVVGLGIITLVAFWIGLSALQRNDMDCLTMLRHLALGALHSPEISDTLYYQPLAAGVMLFVYLFLIIVVIGTLFTASFLTTMLTIYPRIDSVRRIFLTSRCAKQSTFGVFIANVFIEIIVGFFMFIMVYVFKQNKNDSKTLLWTERIRQVLWFIVYFPIVLVIGSIEGIYYLVVLGRHRLQGYHILK